MARTSGPSSAPARRPAAPAARATLPQRIAAVRQWLTEGVPPAQIPALAAAQWGVAPRSARRYLRRVRQGWAASASAEDYLAHLWLAKCQREQLYDKAMRQLSKLKEGPAAFKLIAACSQLLRERDELMAKLAKHRDESARDASPDRRGLRAGLITVQERELEERFAQQAKMLRAQWELDQALQQGAAGAD